MGPSDTVVAAMSVVLHCLVMRCIFYAISFELQVKHISLSFDSASVRITSLVSSSCCLHRSLLFNICQATCQRRQVIRMAGRTYAGDASKAEAPPTAEIATEAQKPTVTLKVSKMYRMYMDHVVIYDRLRSSEIIYDYLR